MFFKQTKVKYMLPDDFDPDEYLDMNPDVRKAKVDPIEHFLYTGHKELRNYKKPFKIFIDKKNNIEKRKKIIIHIGLGRCGSSSLQGALASFRKDFINHGILYPEDVDGGVAHHHLAPLKSEMLANTLQSWEKTIKDFELSGSETLLLSSENFIAVPDSLLKFIQRFTDNYNFKIIFLGRNQETLLPSIYSQWCKTGVFISGFNKFYSDTRHLWHFPVILQRWSNLFGVSNIHCRILLKDDNSVSVFSEIFSEISEHRLIANSISVRANESLPYLCLIILKIFDRANRRCNFKNGFPGWDKVHPENPYKNAQLRANILYALESYSRKNKILKPFKISKKQINDIVKYYSESNLLYSAVYNSANKSAKSLE